LYHVASLFEWGDGGAGEGFEEAAFGGDELADEGAFAVLKKQNLFFDGVAGDQFVDEHGLGLADPMGAVKRVDKFYYSVIL
jgi:hypothetical protein